MSATGSAMSRTHLPALADAAPEIADVAAPQPRGGDVEDSPELDAARASIRADADALLASDPVKGDAANQVDAISGADPATPKPVGRTIKLEGGVHIVGPGDSLWSIANAYYGRGTYWKTIQTANPGKVHGPKHIIRDGDVLRVPDLEVPTLEAMKNHEDQPEEMRDLAVEMSDAEYQGFLDGMSAKEQEKNAVLLQQIEMARATGMTPDEMADEQKKYLEEQAAAKGVTVGEYIRDLIATKGYGGGTADEWNALKPAEKKDYEKRFKKAVATIKKTAPPDVLDIIKTAEKNGGGFSWDPEHTEKLGAFAYTSGDWKLHCGTSFVEAAESDPERVYANISHEMGGHNFYGDRNAGWDVQSAAFEKLPEDERDIAESGGNSMYSTYGYMETEIFAELYEYSYDRKDNPTDHPFDTNPKGEDMKDPARPHRHDDIAHKLERIKEAFAPKVAEGIVRGLHRRVQVDSHILPEAKQRYRAAVEDVFGFEP